jgi:hypothetical protein
LTVTGVSALASALEAMGRPARGWA